MDCLLYARDAGAGQPELDLGRRGLQVDGRRVRRVRHEVQPSATHDGEFPRVVSLRVTTSGRPLRPSTASHARSLRGRARRPVAAPRHDRRGVRADGSSCSTSLRVAARIEGVAGNRRCARSTRSAGAIRRRASTPQAWRGDRDGGGVRRPRAAVARDRGRATALSSRSRGRWTVGPSSFARHGGRCAGRDRRGRSRSGCWSREP